MKKWILTATAAGLVAMGAPTAHAGDREWATVGKVLTGVAAGVVIANAFNPPPACASVSYGYATPGYSISYTVSAPPPCPPPPRVVCPPPRVVCAPPPVVYVPAPVVMAYPPVVCAPRPMVCAPPRASHSGNYSHGNGHAYGHDHANGHR